MNMELVDKRILIFCLSCLAAGNLGYFDMKNTQKDKEKYFTSLYLFVMIKLVAFLVVGKIVEIAKNQDMEINDLAIYSLTILFITPALIKK